MITWENDGKGYLIPSCDKCEIVVINGIPQHEHGCPDEFWSDDEDSDECDEDELGSEYERE